MCTEEDETWLDVKLEQSSTDQWNKVHIKVSGIMRVAGLIALIFASITAIPSCSEKAQDSSSQKFVPTDSNELDPLTFVPKGRLEVEQSFQNYLIRIYNKDVYDGSFEILKNNHRVYARMGGRFRIGGIYGDQDLKDLKKQDLDYVQAHTNARPDFTLQELRGIPLQDSLLRMGNDITGNGKPNLVVTELTGGAHCCFIFYVFEIGDEFRKIAPIDVQDADLTRFKDLDGDSKLEIILYDFSFAYWASSFVSSPAPKMILRFRNGAYHLAGELMRKPAPSRLELEKKAKQIQDTLTKEGGINWGCSTCSNLWAVMLDLIYTGNEDLAWQFLGMAWPKEVKGKEEFLKDFKEQLATSPYWPEIQAMNAK